MNAPLETLALGRLDMELIRVQLPLLAPFETSFAVQTTKEALLVRLQSDGLSAWGECVAFSDPFYSYETIETARHIIADFLYPQLLESRSFEDMLTRFRHVRGHAMAKAAVENAVLDMLAKRQGLPLYALLGGQRRKIRSGVSLGIRDRVADLIASIETALERGYHRIKLKIKRGSDVEVVRAVRARFPDAMLTVDANADYVLADASTLRELDPFGLAMIEQPLSHDDMWQHSLLARELRTPICLDESVESLEDARAAIAMGACRVINIKQGRVGGLHESRAIAAYGAAHQIGIWSGGMLETGIGRAVNLHLQALPGFDLPGDTSETCRYFQEDIVEPPVVLDRDGYIEIPEGPGIGAQVQPDRLARYTVSRERLPAVT